MENINSLQFYTEKEIELTISLLENKINQLHYAMERVRIFEQAKAMREKEHFQTFKAGQDSTEEGGKSFDQYFKN